MATSKSGGSTQNGRDSKGRRLGCKKFGGQYVLAGNIIIRQRGTKIFPGKGVMRGKDDTLFAVSEGIVKFYQGYRRKKYVSVIDDTRQS